MPRIPEFNQQKVGIGQLNLGNNMQGQTADQIDGGMGKALQSSALVMDKVLDDLQAKDDLTRLNKAKVSILDHDGKMLNGYQDDTGQLVPGLLNLKGDKAKNLQTQYDSSMVKVRQEQLDALKDAPHLQEMFNVFADEHKISSHNKVNSYELKSRDNEAKNSSIALGDKLFEQATMELTEKGDIPSSIKNQLKINAATTAELTGTIDPALAAQEAEKKVYSLGIKLALQGPDKLTAVNLYETHADKLDAADKAVLLPHIVEAKAYVYGKENGTEIFNRLQPTDINKPIDTAKMREELKAKNLDEKTAIVAERQIEDKVRELQQQRTAASHGFANDVHGKVQAGMKYADAMQYVQDSTTVDSVDKDNLYSYLDHKFHISEDRQERKAASRDEQNLQQLVYMFDLMKKQINGEVNLKPTDVVGYAGKLGKQTDNFMSWVNDYNNNPAAKVQDEQLKDLIRNITATDSAGKYKGVFPAVDSTDPTNKAKMAILQMEVQAQMAAAKKANVPMTIEQALKNSVEKVQTGTGLMGGKKEDPIYLLNTQYASKHGREPKNWPEATRLRFIKRRHALLNPEGKPLSQYDLQKSDLILMDVEAIQ